MYDILTANGIELTMNRKTRTWNTCQKNDDLISIRYKQPILINY